jgi:effector-binding domain-containing protein
MTTESVVLRPVETTRIAELTAIAESYQGWAIGPVISPLYPELMGRLEAAGVAPAGPAIAYYTAVPDGDRVTVHAGIGVTVDPDPSYDFAVLDLPPIEAAATIVHHGSMSEVMPTMDALRSWVAANGYRQVEWAREVYLDYTPEDADNGVTELQMSVTRA